MVQAGGWLLVSERFDGIEAHLIETLCDRKIGCGARVRSALQGEHLALGAARNFRRGQSGDDPISRGQDERLAAFQPGEPIGKRRAPSDQRSRNVASLDEIWRRGLQIDDDRIIGIEPRFQFLRRNRAGIA